MSNSLSFKLVVGVFYLAVGLILNGCQSSKPKEPQTSQIVPMQVMATPSILPNPLFLTQIKPLTLEGTRSGEGYFSQDGKWIVFQSEREPNNPFYQIYLMNLATRETKRISPGIGKTTCSWIHPSNQKVLFSSTHLDPNFKDKVKEEYKIRKNPVKQKYSWSFDETFDLFEANTDGKNLKRLTKSIGYDAEGSYSPNGEWIAFASNRNGYSKNLSVEEKELFAKDASSQMEIYLMKADGTQVTQLTDHLGYDGGPFFSPDGTKIVWRRFNKAGSSAEVYTMNLDGSQQTQITRLNAMSWAPFYHPSGDYIIFTSNKVGYSNFELYIVDAKGTQEPVRVSYLDGFDGLPVFSPDGHKLIWAHTNDRGQSQIYEATWNDTYARTALKLPAAKPDLKLMSERITEIDAKTWVNYLASTEMAGRLSGSPQESEYTRVLGLAFQDMGLKPATGSEMLQTFEFSSGVELGIENDVKLFINGTKKLLKVGVDWIPNSLSKVGMFPKASIVFAGYGIVAPTAANQAAYDSYQDLDVKGKWVIIFKGLPENISNDRRFHLNMYSRLQNRAMAARQKGATGIILVDETLATENGKPYPLSLKFEGRAESVGLPMIQLSRSAAEELFALQNTQIKTLQERLGKGEAIGLDLKQIEIDAYVDLNFKKSQGRNVVSILKVPGAKSTLLLGAHGDHLGNGEIGNSLAKANEATKIHFGADDNASGVAALMEIAHNISSEFKAGRLRLKQNIAFAVWSGEEIGILGSSYFVKNAKLSEPISTYLNMDMVGRLRSELLIQGAGSAKEWYRLLEKVSGTTEIPIAIQDDPYLPTDSMAFYLKGIPTVTFFTGAHSEYHSPRDTAQTLNYQGIAQIAELVKTLSIELVGDGTKDLNSTRPAPLKISKTTNTPLTYQKVESNGPGGTGDRSFRLYLGTIPDYAAEGKEGVLISGTSKDSPAEKAGIKAGDTILELGGVKIKNIYDYVYCLQSMKANEKTPLKVMRANQVVELTIVPVLKADR